MQSPKMCLADFPYLLAAFFSSFCVDREKNFEIFAVFSMRLAYANNM